MPGRSDSGMYPFSARHRRRSRRRRRTRRDRIPRSPSPKPAAMSSNISLPPCGKRRQRGQLRRASIASVRAYCTICIGNLNTLFPDRSYIHQPAIRQAHECFATNRQFESRRSTQDERIGSQRSRVGRQTRSIGTALALNDLNGAQRLNDLNKSRVVQPDDQQRQRRRFSRLAGNLATTGRCLIKRSKSEPAAP